LTERDSRYAIEYCLEHNTSNVRLTQLWGALA